MSLTICASIWTLSAMPWLQILLAVIGLSTSVWLWRIPSRDHPAVSD
jgi:hypothetical protein